MDATTAQVVALFSTNSDLLDIVRIGLERVGFLAVTAPVRDSRTGTLDLAPFVDHHRPRVIVYDLVMPYDRNWEFMKHVREHPIMQGRQFVITTPNLRAAQAVVGRDEQVNEVVSDKDVDAIILAVREALKARPTR